MNELESAKKEIVDLQLYDDAKLFAAANKSAYWGLGAVDDDNSGVTLPADMKKNVNNISNGVNYFDIYLSSLNEVKSIFEDMAELKVSHTAAGAASPPDTDEQEVLEGKYTALITRLNLIKNDAKVGTVTLYGTTNATTNADLTADTDTNLAITSDSTNDDNKIVIAWGSGETDIETHDKKDYMTTFGFSNCNELSDAGVDKLFGYLTADIDTEIAQVNTRHDLLMYKKILVNTQYDYLISGMNEYKEYRSEELSGRIESINRAIEVLDTVHKIKYYC